GKKLYDDLLKIHNQAAKGDLIKYGIVDFGSSNTNIQKMKDKFKKFEKKFNVYNYVFSDQHIKEMLEDIKNFKEKKDVQDFLNNYNKFENFESNDITERMTYFTELYSEEHIRSILYTPMFDALFFNKDSSDANSERRNKDKENVSERTRNPLIPDIKVNYAIYEAEVVTFEQAKTAARKKGLNKAINDSNKLSILLHDQITHFHSILEKRSLKNYINLINVFGIRISELDLDIHIMYLAAPELYLKHKLFSINLPKRLSGFCSIRTCLIDLIRFRLILDESYDSFKGIIRLDSLDSRLANPDTSWIVNIKE
ncbi:14795_t:CDS:2, partial [Entrophospora sp. SA101]